ncbi:protein BCCIP homolog [Penaeus japonicus]|uniref:protein BCCIP homolog n=1 Tax=Penaeus japonicus TaxID=27405 RepID=UPI001C70C2C4|nr:protein BCCIP homolog [Penaeus japonicus]
MSGPMKKPRAVYPEEEYVPEEEDEEMEQDEMIGQTINVEFEGFPANDADFHGIKRLLQQNLRGLEVDVSGIADTIISQNYVGSVIKQVGGEEEEDDDEEANDEMMNSEEDKEEVFGVTSVINLSSRKDEACIAGLRTALVEKSSVHASDAANQMLREILSNESKHVGFLISERVVNLPPQFSLPVFESLGKEVEEAKKKKMPYNFSYLLLISKVYKTEKKKKKKVIETEIWSNAEEEIMSEECIESFEYPVKGDTGMSGEWDEDDDQYTPYRRVLILDAGRMPEIISKVKDAVY